MAIVDVWESADAAQRFDEERLTPAIEAVIGGPVPGRPQETMYEPHSLITP